MGKLTPLLETGQSRPATDKMLVLPDSADKLWKGISGEGVFNILTKNLIKTNYLTNGDFRIDQRGTVAVARTISNSSGRSYCADRWGITNGSASVSFRTVDMGTALAAAGVGDPSRFAAVFQKITAAGKLIVSQVIEGTDTLPLRGKVVRFQFMARNGDVSGPILPLRFGLLSYTTSIDALPATFVTNILDVYFDPYWGTGILSLEPTLIQNGISQIGGGFSPASPSKPLLGVSALADRRWQMYSACFTVPSNCLNLIPVIWTIGAMTIASATTDELWLSAAGLYLGYETVDWTPRPTEEELKICQRHYCKTFAQGTTPAQTVGVNTGEFKFIAGRVGALSNRSNNLNFPVRMRVTPLMTGFDPAAANAQVRDETAAGADCTVQAFAGTIDRQTAVTCTGAAGTAVGNLLGVHVTATADL